MEDLATTLWEMSAYDFLYWAFVAAVAVGMWRMIFGRS